MIVPAPGKIEGVLFDLDGTLLDSAPDLYAALTALCVEENALPPPYAPVRAVVSRGARAVLCCAFGPQGDLTIERLLPRYLQLYQQVMGQQTRPFDGIAELLTRIEAQPMRWGIVTNKRGYLTDLQLSRCGWSQRVSSVVSGDTLPVRKPDPAPVLLACSRAGLTPARCLFVGDDPRDIQAGAAAGLGTVAVSWGYLDGSNPQAWGADCVVDHPDELIGLLQLRTVET